MAQAPVVILDIKHTQGFESLMALVDDIAKLRDLVPAWRGSEVDDIMERVTRNVERLVVVREERCS